MRLSWRVALSILVGVLLLAGWIDWRPSGPARAPRIEVRIRAEAETLHAGAARIELAPPLPATVAGYPPPRATATSAQPLFARAIAIRIANQTVAIASAEVLELPTPIAARVRARVRAQGVDELVVAATHTHTSFGGYDSNPLAQWAATGWYDRASARLLEDALVRSVEEAVAALRPASLRRGTTRLEGVSRNRSSAAGVDPQLTVMAFDGAAGERIGALYLFGSHPTLAPRHALDGDYPSRASAALERDGGVAVFLQGAVGDVSSRPPEDGRPAVDAMAAHVAQAAGEALRAARPAPAVLRVATAEFDLPPPEADLVVPRWLRRPAANALHAAMPATGHVTALELGGQLLLATPAEPTVTVAKALKQRVRPEPGAEIAMVSLANGYAGYLETEDAMYRGEGEARRALYGPLLERRVGEALEACVRDLSTLSPPFPIGKEGGR